PRPHAAVHEDGGRDGGRHGRRRRFRGGARRACQVATDDKPRSARFEMEISASQVKELRERTGSGLMEWKRALVETSGDLDAAIDLMRKQGLVKADKKAGRTAA